MIEQPQDGPARRAEVAAGGRGVLDRDVWATVSITATQTVPTSGFYLMQNDAQSDTQVYFTSDLAIRQVPAPATLPLLLGGLYGLRELRRRRDRQARG